MDGFSTLDNSLAEIEEVIVVKIDGMFEMITEKEIVRTEDMTVQSNAA